MSWECSCPNIIFPSIPLLSLLSLYSGLSPSLFLYSCQKSSVVIKVTCVQVQWELHVYRCNDESYMCTGAMMRVTCVRVQWEAHVYRFNERHMCTVFMRGTHVQDQWELHVYRFNERHTCTGSLRGTCVQCSWEVHMYRINESYMCTGSMRVTFYYVYRVHSTLEINHSQPQAASTLYTQTSCVAHNLEEMEAVACGHACSLCMWAAGSH